MIALTGNNGSNRSTNGTDTSISCTQDITTENFINIEVGYDGDTTGTDRLIGITVGGVSASFIVKQQRGLSTSPVFQQGWIYAYQLVNPPAGLGQTITASFSGATGGNVYIITTGYSGASTTFPVNASTSGAVGSSGALTLSLTTTVDNCWVLSFTQAFQNISTGTNINNNVNLFNKALSGDSASVVHPTGSFSSVTSSVGNAYTGGVMYALAPFVAPPLNSNFLIFF